MPEHTPGPWTIKELPPDDCGEMEPAFLIEAETTLHLIVAPCTDGSVSGQNEANARLIAAAPTMFAELQEVKKFLEGLSYLEDIPHHCTYQRFLCVKAALEMAAP